MIDESAIRIRYEALGAGLDERATPFCSGGGAGGGRRRGQLFRGVA